jgi:TusA-related sulfurtransferase
VNIGVWGDSIVTLEVDVRGQTCPVPLVECRKALRKASPGDEVVVIGTHPASKKEIPMACESLGLDVLAVEDKDNEWKIRIRR